MEKDKEKESFQDRITNHYHTANCKILSKEKGQYVQDTSYPYPWHWYINLTSIQTILIQLTGRFTDNWASDILYVIKQMHDIVDTMTPSDIREKQPILWAGIRRNGVDQIDRLEYREQQTPNVQYYDYYRRILAIGFTVDKHDTLTVTLKDMTDCTF